TASGETFHAHELTAASTTVPIGSVVRVTNLSNGRSVRVRINDCGPYAAHRKIDLSRRAAEKLALTKSGTKKGSVQVLHKSPAPRRCGAVEATPAKKKAAAPHDEASRI